MNIFDPKTFSADWEIMVMDRLERAVDTGKLMGFAGQLKRKLDLPVHVDWNSLEFGLGVNHSLDEVWTNIQLLTDNTTQLLAEYELQLFPAGSTPMEPMFHSAHVHVGTIHDEVSAIYLENQLFGVVPAFAALAANSPSVHRHRDEFKSHRVQYMAHHCTVPNSIRDPETSQSTWGTDICPKIYNLPTIEVRIGDCASSRRFMAEYCSFVAAYVHCMATKLQPGFKPNRQQYREGLLNRWAAAKYGMQATFIIDGQERTAADVLQQMLYECEAQLADLGATISDLGLINAMITKRTCQADMFMELGSRYPELYQYNSVYSKIARHWEAFDQYLESASPKEAVVAVNEETVLEEHLALVGEDTHFYRLRDVMHLSGPDTEEVIQRLIANGMIDRVVTSSRGPRLNRTS